jgi:UDP-glucuronate decarboxylase
LFLKAMGIMHLMLMACQTLQLINPEVAVTMTENTPDDPRQRKPDISKAKEILEWEPKVVLRDGLVLMEDDFRERLSVPKKTKA